MYSSIRADFDVRGIYKYIPTVTNFAIVRPISIFQSTLNIAYAFKSNKLV